MDILVLGGAGQVGTAILTQTHGVAPRPWEQALDDMLDRLVGPVRSVERHRSMKESVR